jgi:hypothetical protein
LTKNEKELIKLLEVIMERKNIEGDPKDLYTITKRSSKDYYAESIINYSFYSAQGKDIRDVIKKLIKELKTKKQQNV